MGAKLHLTGTREREWREGDFSGHGENGWFELEIETEKQAEDLHPGMSHSFPRSAASAAWGAMTQNCILNYSFSL
jgi:hypothetical protein